MRYLRVVLFVVASICNVALKGAVEEVFIKRFVESEDTLKGVKLDEAIISAKVKTLRNYTPMNISVVESEEIEFFGHSSVLPALSGLVPGLFVTQKGVTGFGVSEGSAGIVNIRGVGQGNKVLMLLDGQPQWAGVFGHSIPDLYVASDVERVEVVKGPVSLLFGSNAMGGAVNVITRGGEGKRGRESRVKAEYGSYNTYKFMANTGYKSEKIKVFVSANHDRSSGHRSNSKFNMTNGFAKIDYKLSDLFTLSSNLSLAKIYNENPGRVDATLEDNKMDLLRSSFSVSLNNQHKFGSGSLMFYLNSGYHEINDGYVTGGLPRDYLFYSNDHNYGITLYENFSLFKNNTITLGVDYKNWGGRAWTESISDQSETELTDKDIDETAGYLVIQHDFMDNFTFNAGVRFEYNSVFGPEWVPQAGISFRPGSDDFVKISLSKGYRSPTVREMFMFPPQNADLLPENMLNYELTYGRSFVNNSIYAELSLFYIDGWNMIEIVRVGGVPKYLNTGAFNNSGVELKASLRIMTDLKADVNYSYLNTNVPILAAPAHQFFSALYFTPGIFSFNAGLQHIGDMYINTSTMVKENYTLLNLRASVKLGFINSSSSFFVHCDNVTGTDYSINEGFPMPGTVIRGGFDLIF